MKSPIAAFVGVVTVAVWASSLCAARGDGSGGQASLQAAPNAPPDIPGLVWIPAGTFTMGSPSSEQDRFPREGPETVVVITRGYYIGQHEVTQGEYEAVIGNNPSGFKGDANRPVEMVTRSDATNYCAKLTAREREAGRIQANWTYRLPTEAEWEYACRAGTTTRFSFGDDLGYVKVGDYAWYNGNSASTAHPVDMKLPNPWGLYDMHGNVWEYCLDWFADSLPGGTVTDPVGPASGVYCVVRGGSWFLAPSYSRSAYRGDWYADGQASSIGFRVVLAPQVVPVAITVQPQSQKVAEGSSVTFTVEALGDPPLAYQWRKNGRELADSERISGTTTATLTIVLVQATDAGSYDVLVRNERSTAISRGAFLTLVDPNAPPDIPGLVWVAAGAFTMGSPASEQDRFPREGPETVVVITRGYYIGQHEVTQGEYEAVMGNNPSEFKGDANRPVEMVTRSDATNYCAKLTAREREAGRIQANWTYRLPTEAEWEYACRAGTTTRFSFGDDLGYVKVGDYAWYNGNSASMAHPVDMKLPNPWGLYDMHGNVWEYCLDWFADSLPGGTVTDPVGPASGVYCVVRGGSWFLAPPYSRSAYRGDWYADGRASSIGLRVVLASLVAPTITAHPQSRTVAEGSSVTFTVEASGSPRVSYQWTLDGTDIAGATSASLTLASVKAADAGSYAVRVSNEAGSVTSDTAFLKVLTTFTAITTGNIVSDGGNSFNGVWGDYDNDGNLDLFVANLDHQNNFLYHNKGDGTFEKVTTGAVVTDAASSAAGAWADCDNDGNLDLFVANFWGENNCLYRNNGDGTFATVSTGSIVSDGGFSCSCALADYDNDGHLDVFVSNGGGAQNENNFLYRNNGNGTFTKVTAGGIANDGGYSAGCAWADYDNDGYPDLFVCNMYSAASFLYHNNRDGSFTRVTQGDIAAATGDFAGCAWGDYDNDGFLDLFVANGGQKNNLYHNNRDGTFSRVASGAIVDEVGNWIGCAWADYDNDGCLDLFVANRTGKNCLYHNNGDGTFTKVTAGAIVEDVNASNGCAWGDYDNDGFLDLFVANWDGQNNCLYHNSGNGNNWLKVKCVGVVSNRSGIGAKVRVKTVVGGKELWQMREIGGGDALGSQSLLAHFGLGEAATVQTVRVEWPSGVIQEFQDVGAKQVLTVNETPPALCARPYAGNFDHSIEVSLLSSVTGGVIRYTLDATEPTAESPAYSAPFKLSQTTTVKARVFVEGNPASDVLTATYTITLTPPTIVTQPVNKTVTEGGSVTFSVTVTGSPPLFYQWTFNGSDLAGATNSSLSLSGVTAAQAGDYTVKLSNEVGAVTSSTATLTVNPKPTAPTITKQPEALTVVVSGTATFTVEATGTAPLSYLWRLNGVSLSGATNATLTIQNVQSSQAGTYTVRVSNPYGSKTSEGAVLTVLDRPVPPTITAAPEDRVVNAGVDVVLSVTATGTAPLAYQWRFNGAAIPDAAGATLSLTNAQPANSGTYTVTVSNSAGTASTGGAVLDVYSGETGGTIYFNNYCLACGIDAPVFDTDGTTKLQGPAYLAQLYAGPSAESLLPVGPAVPFRTGTFAGYVSGGADPSRIVPSVPAGEVACVEVRAWDCAKGTSYEQALAAGGKVGRSQTLALKTGGRGAPPELPADLTGLQSFSIAPEAIPPVVTITSPAAGVTHDERALLAGAATDNAGVAAARWERDGQAVGSLALENGQFRVPDLRLHGGENRFRVVATDVAGNEGSAEVVVTWEPSRTLAVQNAAEQQEGRPITMALELASGGDVAGLSFVLQYSPEYLAEPELAWSALVSSGISQVNCDTPGEIRATLSLPAATIPAGSQVLGQLSFRARSVPSPLETSVAPVVLDVADALGNKVTFGTDTAAGAARILPRRIIGDNNANDRLDVGDATVMQRLIARFDIPRAWDVAANDLNQSRDLDSGDVIKVLRVVVGLDPQPEVPGGAGQHGLVAGARANVSRHGSATQPRSEAAAESTALVTDQLRASPGEFVTIQVWLKNLATPISAASFTLDYPADALRLLNPQAHRLGPTVAADSALWNVAPSYEAQTGRVSVAAISANPWTLTSGVLAEFTFQVQAGALGQGRWPLQLSAVEVAGKNGYDVRTLPGATLGLNPPPPRLPGKLQLSGDTRRLLLEGEVGLAYLVQASSDLQEWKDLKTLVNTDGVLEFVDPEAAAANARFYRVKEAP
jgi:formylglycine-generating enzyme required for sulfatase activity